MKLIVKGRNIAVTETLSGYAEEKIGRLCEVPPRRRAVRRRVVDGEEPQQADNQVAEVTCTPRARSSARGRRRPTCTPRSTWSFEQDRAAGQEVPFASSSPVISRCTARSSSARASVPPTRTKRRRGRADISPRIVKTKQFMVKPMTPEEAALQLELVGHDFFVFTNAESQRDRGGVSPPRRQLRPDRAPALARRRGRLPGPPAHQQERRSMIARRQGPSLRRRQEAQDARRSGRRGGGARAADAAALRRAAAGARPTSSGGAWPRARPWTTSCPRRSRSLARRPGAPRACGPSTCRSWARSACTRAPSPR